MIEFRWRGRETGEGESTFGEENIAKFTFIDSGKFSGNMYWDCVGIFQIVGKKDIERSKNRVWSKNVLTWKSKFYELNQENYDAESVERWGGYYHRSSRQEPNSDTEGDCESEGEDDEDENWG